MNANDKQVDGDHYQAKIQHWDFAYANDLNIFEVYITKYVSRCRKKHKDPLIDLYKAKHTLDKYIEVLEQLPEPKSSHPYATIDPEQEEFIEQHMNENRGKIK